MYLFKMCLITLTALNGKLMGVGGLRFFLFEEVMKQFR